MCALQTQGEIGSRPGIERIVLATSLFCCRRRRFRRSSDRCTRANEKSERNEKPPAQRNAPLFGLPHILNGSFGHSLRKPYLPLEATVLAVLLMDAGSRPLIASRQTPVTLYIGAVSYAGLPMKSLPPLI